MGVGLKRKRKEKKRKENRERKREMRERSLGRAAQGVSSPLSADSFPFKNSKLIVETTKINSELKQKKRMFFSSTYIYLVYLNLLLSHKQISLFYTLKSYDGK